MRGRLHPALAARRREVSAERGLRRRSILVTAIGALAALTLVGASATLLVLAGLIEGFLSASDAPAAFKLGVSAASAGLVVLYFAAGKWVTAGEGGISPPSR